MNESPSTEPKDLKKSFGAQMIFFALAEWIFRLRTLIVIPILSRLLGTEGFGLVSALISLAGLFQIAIGLGLNTAIKIYIPGTEQKQRAREFWGLIQISTMVAAIVVIGMLLFFPNIKAAALPSEMTFILFIPGALMVPLNSLHNLLRAQIINQKVSPSYSTIITKTSIAEIFFYIVGGTFAGTLGVLYAMVLSLSLRNLMMINLIKREDKFVPLRRSLLPDIKKYYVYGLTLVILSLANWIVNSSDRLIVGYYLGSEALGIYNAAYSITNRVNGIVPIFAALMPFIAEAITQQSLMKARRYLVGTYKLLIMIYAPAAILISLNRVDIISLLTSTEFIPGAAFIPFVAIGVFFSQLSGVYSYNVHAHKRGRLLLISTGIASVLNLSFNIFFVPIYGAIAASISTAFSFLVMFLINRILSNRLLPILIDPAFLLKAFFSLLLMFITSWGLLEFGHSWNGFVRIATSSLAGGLVFLGMMLILKVFSIEERNYFSSIFKSFINSRR